MGAEQVVILRDESGVAIIERNRPKSATRASIWNHDGTLRAELRMPPSEPAESMFYYFECTPRGFEVVIASRLGDKGWLVDVEQGTITLPRPSR
jgi:hypothetical protein